DASAVVVREGEERVRFIARHHVARLDESQRAYREQTRGEGGIAALLAADQDALIAQRQDRAHAHLALFREAKATVDRTGGSQTLHLAGAGEEKIAVGQGGNDRRLEPGGALQPESRVNRTISLEAQERGRRRGQLRSRPGG